MDNNGLQALVGRGKHFDHQQVSDFSRVADAPASVTMVNHHAGKQNVRKSLTVHDIHEKRNRYNARGGETAQWEKKREKKKQ